MSCQLIPHVCPSCGHVRYLQPYDAARTKQCQHCHCQQIAPLGFRATAEKHGRDFAIRAAARKRKLTPSSLEQRVEAALRDIPGIAWEREYMVEREGHNPYFVDFAIRTDRYFLALEVNGHYAHRQDQASLRFETLFLYFDDVIVLTENDVKQSPSLRDRLQKWIED